MFRQFAIATVLLASLTSMAQAANINLNTHGDPANSASAERTIKLAPTTRWVNVTDGETVRFTKDGHTFAWRFSTINSAMFDLSTIAPADVDVKGVRVYVAANSAFGGA